MKGNEKVIKALNKALCDELTAIVQYMVQAEICENWGYGKLAGLTKGRAIEEMRHAERLIERIIFLDGTPNVNVPLTRKSGRLSSSNSKSTWHRRAAPFANTTRECRSARAPAMRAAKTYSKPCCGMKRSTPTFWRRSCIRSRKWGSGHIFRSRWKSRKGNSSPQRHGEHGDFLKFQFSVSSVSLWFTTALFHFFFTATTLSSGLRSISLSTGSMPACAGCLSTVMVRSVFS